MGNTERAIEPVLFPQDSETILLVEDKATLRTSIKKGLEINGYKVLAAGNGNEALLISQWHRAPIHLVLTDVVMPGMNGQEIAESLTLSPPEAKGIYMSGYTDNAVLRHRILNKKTTFLQKPFTPKALASKVREILDLPL